MLFMLQSGLNQAEECGKGVRSPHSKAAVSGESRCMVEVKLSQFADDTNLICAGIPSVHVENSLQILTDFGKISGLKLNKEKTKAMWLGSLANSKDKPLGLN